MPLDEILIKEEDYRIIKQLQLKAGMTEIRISQLQFQDLKYEQKTMNSKKTAESKISE